jgi:PAS domain S-box-containing protein
MGLDNEISVQIQTRLIEQISAYEGRYRRLVDNLHDIVVELDADGRISFVNRSWSAWLKHPLETARGQPLAAYMSEADAKAVGRIMGSLQHDSAPEHRLDVALQDAQGGWHEFELALRRGHPGGWLAVFRGNAERRAAEAQLREANAFLKEAARLKDNFMATMSHELRTPLNATLALCECLNEEVYGPMPAAQRQAIQTIEQSGKHLLQLINDILDLSRIEAGMMPMAEDPVELGPLLRECGGMLAPLADRKCQFFVQEIPPETGRVFADRSRLRQVLVNLVGNACKFTPPGGKITLRTARRGPRQFITIQDTGLGIAPQSQRLLFRSFAQADAGLNREKQEGSGLGLVLCQRMVELMGGSISYSTWPGLGSRFSIGLPACEDIPGPLAVPDALPGRVLLVTRHPRIPPAWAGQTVSFNDQTRRATGEVFAKLAGQVVAVNDEQEAERELAESRFHTVILHPRIGVGPDPEVVARFRQKLGSQGTQLLAACSLLSLYHCRELHQAGADGCLLLPLDWQELAFWMEATAVS